MITLMKPLLLSILLLCALLSQGQPFRGVVADSINRQPLPFATIQLQGGKQSRISDIDGSFTLPASATAFLVSHVGHRTRTVLVSEIKSGDTVFLERESRQMEPVVIRS